MNHFFIIKLIHVLLNKKNEFPQSAASSSAHESAGALGYWSQWAQVCCQPYLAVVLQSKLKLFLIILENDVFTCKHIFSVCW